MSTTTGKLCGKRAYRENDGNDELTRETYAGRVFYFVVVGLPARNRSRRVHKGAPGEGVELTHVPRINDAYVATDRMKRVLANVYAPNESTYVEET